MTMSSKENIEREELITSLETRRQKLNISKRALAKKAGLNEAYYQHLVAGGFQFPTVRKLDAIKDALTKLEKIASFEAGLK